MTSVLMAPSAPELDGFRLVLVGTRTPGNVGASARAAANFGCRDFVMADARCRWRNWNARKYATSASREVFEGARAVKTVREAVADCEVAIGFTRRLGGARRPSITVGEIAELARKGRVALVFGNEETGLSTEELSACTRLCRLPTSDAMPSMNLSHAVAVVLARVFEDRTGQGTLARARKTLTPARLAEFEGMLDHWREFLDDIDLRVAGNPDRMVSSLRKLFGRAELTPREVRALRGMLSKAQVKLGVRSRGKRV